MSLVHNIPSDVLTRLRDYVKSIDDDFTPTLSSNRLFDILIPKTNSQLIKIIQILIENRILKQIVRVTSPSTGAGIKDYNSIIDVPNEIHDFYADTVIYNVQDNIKILYEFKKDNFISLTKEKL